MNLHTVLAAVVLSATAVAASAAPVAPTEVVKLERVVVTGKSVKVAYLPRVVVTGYSADTLARMSTLAAAKPTPAKRG